MTTPTTGAARATGQHDIVRIALVGLAAGFLSGLFGVGGGILIVPALVLVLKMEQRLAHGTSLAAVLPISVASLATYWANGNVDWPVAFWIAVGAVTGAVLGTKLLHVLPERVLGYAFAALLVVTAVRLFIDTEAAGRGELSVATVIGLVVLGLASGVLAGLLGVGGGIVMVPAMVVLFHMAPVLAKGTSVAVIIPTAIMGTWRNRKKRNADLRVAMILGGAGIVSAVAGGVISDRLSDSLSNVLFATLLLVVAARMIYGYVKEGKPSPHDEPLMEPGEV
jgi:uncharacterized membrane protein YfcA